MPKLCEFENCHKRASYGYRYGKPKRCKEHKEDMKPQYSICKCGKAKPSFNYEGEKAMYCSSCIKDGMINVNNKKCSCGESRPSFNYEGEKAMYCSLCKEGGMINVNSKKCSCGKAHPSFNYEGEKAMYCSSCIKDGMIDVINKKCSCDKAIIPCFNFEGETKAICCNSCIKDGMIDVKNKRCKGQDGLCTVRANPKYKGYCGFCFSHTFPKDPLTFQIRCKTKEIAVRDFINSNYEGFVHDKPLHTHNCECTHRRRIDHRILINDTMLCIETDEFQHKGYDKDDEEIRYNDLYMMHGGKWIYIRFNPDKYKDKNGTTRNPAIGTRLRKLQQEIDKQLDRINNSKNTELLEIIKLYYNEDF